MSLNCLDFRNLLTFYDIDKLRYGWVQLRWLRCSFSSVQGWNLDNRDVPHWGCEFVFCGSVPRCRVDQSHFFTLFSIQRLIVTCSIRTANDFEKLSPFWNRFDGNLGGMKRAAQLELSYRGNNDYRMRLIWQSCVAFLVQALKLIQLKKTSNSNDDTERSLSFFDKF